MGVEINNAVNAADTEAQYDEKAKRMTCQGYPWKGGLDLLNIVKIGIANELPEHDDKLREDVNAMCNLSQGIKDAENAKIIMNMHKKGYTSEQIAEIVEKTIEEVEDVIRKREPVLA